MGREYGAKYEAYYYYLELSTVPAKHPLQEADARAQLWARVPGPLLEPGQCHARARRHLSI